MDHEAVKWSCSVFVVSCSTVIPAHFALSTKKSGPYIVSRSSLCVATFDCLCLSNEGELAYRKFYIPNQATVESACNLFTSTKTLLPFKFNEKMIQTSV